MTKKVKAPMSVVEAGRQGGLKLAKEKGRDYYVAIGKKGGASLRELVAAGRKAMTRKGK